MKYIFYLLFLLIILGCDTESDSIGNASNTAVVEGFLYVNQPIDSIRITKVIDYLVNDTLLPLDDLEVYIQVDGNALLLENIGDGYYRSLDHTVRPNLDYDLSFFYDGDTVSANTFTNSPVDVSISSTTIFLDKIENTGGFPTNINLDPVIVDLEWENDSGDFYFIDMVNTTEDPEYVNELIVSLGEDIPDIPLMTEPDIISGYSINSRRHLFTYGEYLISIYRLNPEYAALFQGSEGSTLSISEPPSNLENGVGIFTAITPHFLNLSVKK